MNMRKPVHVVALGGTIAMTSSDAGGATPSLTGRALVDAVPGLADVANVSAENFRQLPGASLRLTDIVALREHLAVRGERGFVITQGTDTLEETAFAFDLLYADDHPVVFTGAMRPPSTPGADGGANLLNAVRTATADAAQGQGVLVTMDDRIHTAHFVRKQHSSAPSAFGSASVGPVGWVAEDRVRLPLSVRHRVHIDVRDTDDLPLVALVRPGLGDDGRILAALADSCNGVIIDAMGVGHLPAWWAEPVAELAASVPVVVASRTGAGESFRSTYGFDGSERDLLERGVIGAGALDGLKARVLLTLALADGWSRDDIDAAIQVISG